MVRKVMRMDARRLLFRHPQHSPSPSLVHEDVKDGMPILEFEEEGEEGIKKPRDATPERFTGSQPRSDSEEYELLPIECVAKNDTHSTTSSSSSSRSASITQDMPRYDMEHTPEVCHRAADTTLSPLDSSVPKSMPRSRSSSSSRSKRSNSSMERTNLIAVSGSAGATTSNEPVFNEEKSDAPDEKVCWIEDAEARRPRVAETDSAQPPSAKIDLHRQELYLQEKMEAAKMELNRLESHGIRDQMDHSCLTNDLLELITLFGYPYIMAPSEAEAQCAALQRAGIVDAVLTEDSDVLVFGGTRVLLHVFSSKEPTPTLVDTTQAQLTQEDMMALAMLLGGDYADGVYGIGPVTAMGILTCFGWDSAGCGVQDLVCPCETILGRFHAWWTQQQQQQAPPNGGGPFERLTDQVLRALQRKGVSIRFPPLFPNPAVIAAYRTPNIHPVDAIDARYNAETLNATWERLVVHLPWTALTNYLESALQERFSSLASLLNAAHKAVLQQRERTLHAHLPRAPAETAGAEGAQDAGEASRQRKLEHWFRPTLPSATAAHASGSIEAYMAEKTCETHASTLSVPRKLIIALGALRQSTNPVATTQEVISFLQPTRQQKKHARQGKLGTESLTDTQSDTQPSKECKNKAAPRRRRQQC